MDKAIQREIEREIEMEGKGILRDKYVTALNKAKFANRIKGGLGEEIKKAPKAVKVIKKPIGQRIKEWLTSIFTKF
jgi:hypothetical protein